MEGPHSNATGSAGFLLMNLEVRTAVLLKHKGLMFIEQEQVYVLHSRIHVMQLQRVGYEMIQVVFR